jgi:hypothetical protein
MQRAECPLSGGRSIGSTCRRRLAKALAKTASTSTDRAPEDFNLATDAIGIVTAFPSFDAIQVQ